MDIVKFEITEDKIIVIKGEQVLLDSDVAELYGVETKQINEAVKNNPDRFPAGYIIALNNKEKNELVENFDQFSRLKHSSANHKVFTEKGLYMLATILKNSAAVKTTLSIIETAAKIRLLSRSIQQLSVIQNKAEQKPLMQKSGELIVEIFDDDLQTSDTETSIELNFTVLKFKHMVKKKNK